MPMTAPGEGRDRATKMQQRRAAIRDKWARRHPAAATEERGLKRANRAARRDFGHKQNGTPETHARASRLRQGALARLFEAGHLTIDQLASAQSIRITAERIGSGLRSTIV